MSPYFLTTLDTVHVKFLRFNSEETESGRQQSASHKWWTELLAGRSIRGWVMSSLLATTPNSPRGDSCCGFWRSFAPFVWCASSQAHAICMGPCWNHLGLLLFPIISAHLDLYVCTSMESGDKDRLRQTTKAGDQAAVLLALLSLLQIFLAAIVRLIPYL